MKTLLIAGLSWDVSERTFEAIHPKLLPVVPDDYTGPINEFDGRSPGYDKTVFKFNGRCRFTHIELTMIMLDAINAEAEAHTNPVLPEFVGPESGPKPMLASKPDSEPVIEPAPTEGLAEPEV